MCSIFTSKYLNKYNKNVTIFRQSLQDINNEFKYAPVCNKLSIYFNDWIRI